MSISDRTERVLVFAPAGRDAKVACDIVATVGIEGLGVASGEQLGLEVSRGAGAVIATEEAIAGSDMRDLSAWVRRQPSWADLPFIVLTRPAIAGRDGVGSDALTSALANVRFLERPFHAKALIGVVRSALRSRRRQYGARDAMAASTEMEARLRVAMDAGHLGAWELDLGAQRLVASPQCKAHYGRRADDPFDYADLRASVHRDDAATMQAAVARSVETGADYAIVYRCCWPDSSVHWVEVKGRVRRDAQGRAVSMSGVSADVTQRMEWAEVQRRLLAELSVERAELERRVLARTADLERTYAELRQQVDAKERAETQLRQSQKLETMGQMVGGVAHDFNNLLMVILSSLELLRRRTAGDPLTLRLIDTARRGAERGSGLTKRLLAFARKQDLEPERIDAIELATSTVELARRSVGPQMEIELRTDGSDAAVMADRNQLEMALLNLVVNARDALDGDGRIVIAVRTEPSGSAPEVGLPPGRYVSFSVEDDGVGMDEATLAKAVEPFFSTKGVGKGTGLGLSMVHGMASQSKGTLRLTSRLGEGTTASIWLPSAEGVSAAETSMPAFAPSQPPRNGTVLMVDDDELVAASVSAMLEDLGYEVVLKHSGSAALEALQSGPPPDVLLTDQAMPAMTGLELIERVRATLPTLPVILASGYADFAGEPPPGLPRLTKPFSQAQLEAELNRLRADG